MSWSTIQTTFCVDGERQYSELSTRPLLKLPKYSNQMITDSGDMYFQLYDKIVCITVEGIIKKWYNKATITSFVKMILFSIHTLTHMEIN
jgi:hypothetical protein